MIPIHFQKSPCVWPLHFISLHAHLHTFTPTLTFIPTVILIYATDFISPATRCRYCDRPHVRHLQDAGFWYPVVGRFLPPVNGHLHRDGLPALLAPGVRHVSWPAHIQHGRLQAWSHRAPCYARVLPLQVCKETLLFEPKVHTPALPACEQTFQAQFSTIEVFI